MAFGPGQGTHVCLQESRKLGLRHGQRHWTEQPRRRQGKKAWPLAVEHELAHHQAWQWRGHHVPGCMCMLSDRHGQGCGMSWRTNGGLRGSGKRLVRLLDKKWG